MTGIKTYVGSDGKLHFVDASGADSVLPFSSEPELLYDGSAMVSNHTYTHSGDERTVFVVSTCIGHTGYPHGEDVNPANSITNSSGLSVTTVSDYTATYLFGEINTIVKMRITTYKTTVKKGTTLTVTPYYRGKVSIFG